MKKSIPNKAWPEFPEIRFCGDSATRRFDTGPEAAYLAGILRGTPNACPSATPTRWFQALDLLSAHWIKPLLYWHIRRLPPESAPPEAVVHHLKHAFQVSVGACLQMERQLGEILETFRGHGLPMMVLKGPALARTVYPHPATRPSSDLDLLVRPDHVRTARKLLVGLGYRCLAKRFDLARDFYKDEIFLKNHGTKDHRQVELHWALHKFGGVTSIDVEPYFEHAMEVSSPPLAFLSMDTVDALIHRAMNNSYYKSREMRFIWLADTLYLCREIDRLSQWHELQHRSVRYHARLAVEWNLRETKQRLGLEIPAEYADFLSWPSASTRELSAWPRLLSKQGSLLNRIGLHLSADLPLPRLIRYLLHFLFPSPHHLRRPYGPSPDHTLPIIYFRRLLRWVLRGGNHRT